MWDAYYPNSIKEYAREKRGEGTRRKVSANTTLPGDWAKFLRNPHNKQELFNFLSNEVGEASISCKIVYITSGQNVLCVGDGPSMTVCGHEEADTRMVVHARHAIENGYSAI